MVQGQGQDLHPDLPEENPAAAALTDHKAEADGIPVLLLQGLYRREKAPQNVNL
jgi:hypothetical protein